MRIRLVAVGHRQPVWIDSGCDEYVKRLPREWDFQLVLLKTAPREGRAAADAVRAEARAIEASMPAGWLRVALDERGRAMTTAELAGALRGWQQDARDVAFVIGGPDGLDPSVKSGAGLLLSLSAMTLPHGLARLLLVEQLYRAASLLSGHPYHRA
jgi:23S rRNA (pseudouridine1915-N3)-methyltransferase